MAQVREVRLVDDRDGSEAEESIHFSYRGLHYEIDLNAKHAQAFDESMEEWVECARPTKAVKSKAKRARMHVQAQAAQTPARSDAWQNQAIRDWASRNGFSVAARGRVPAKVREAFDAAS